MEKSKLKFKGKVEGNKFVPDQSDAFWNHVRSYEGQDVVMTMKKYRDGKDKSLQQLGYYFGYMIPVLMDYFGYTKLEMHSALKYQILIVERVVIQKLPHTPSIEDYSTTEFEDYMREAREWASREHKIWLDLPNQQGFDFKLYNR